MKYIPATSYLLMFLVTAFSVHKAYQAQEQAFQAYRAYDESRNAAEAFKRTMGRHIDSAYVCKEKR